MSELGCHGPYRISTHFLDPIICWKDIRSVENAVYKREGIFWSKKEFRILTAAPASLHQGISAAERARGGAGEMVGDDALRRQVLADCFYACKVMAVLLHPIAPEGCEKFREYMRIGDILWNWDYILEPISFYTGDLPRHELKMLEPREDFFKKHERQLGQRG